MSDVRDILTGVSNQNGGNINNKNEIESILTAKQQNANKRQKGDTPKTTMEKLQQTFKSLEGETITFAPQQLTKSGLKEKRRIKVNWDSKAFRNNSRNDNLILHHWVKSNEKPNDYKYSKYNKKMEILVYNEEEYDLYLRDDKWSREDTDLLLDLCKRFDTRFIIIADRFEGQTKRTVEDLKERYYRIQSKLIELRTKPEEDPFHNPLTTYVFNKVYETQRKLQSDILFHLTKEEVNEEEQLVEKYNTIENHLLKHSKESRSVLKVSQIAINNGPLKHYNVQQDLQNRGVQGSYTGKNKNKRKLSDIQDQQQQQQQQQQSNNVSINGLDDDTQITLNTRQGSRIESTLFDLHIGRPTNNFSKLYYNDLKEDILILLDLQKYYMEKRYHCEILKSQKDFLKEELEQLKATIPAEALALHVDEENETIQNNVDDHHNLSHHHPSLQHQSSSHRHHGSSSSSSSSGHRHHGSSNSRDHHHHHHHQNTTTTHHHKENHHDKSSHSTSSQSSTPFQMYSGQFPEKQKEIPLPSTERPHHEKSTKSHKKTSSSGGSNTTQQHNTTTTTPTSTITPPTNPILQQIGTPIMPPLNISPTTPQYPHQNISIGIPITAASTASPINTNTTPIITGQTTPIITPNLTGIPIISPTTIGVTSPTSSDKKEDSSGAFGSLNDLINQGLNNSINQQKEVLSKKMAKEKRQQEKAEKAEKKNAAKKEKKTTPKAAANNTTPISTPSSLTPASTPSTTTSTPLVNQSFTLNNNIVGGVVQQPPLININSPQQLVSPTNTVSPQSTASIASPPPSSTISPSHGKKEPKKPKEPKEPKKPKKEKEPKEPKEKKERKKREPKNSTTAATTTPIVSGGQITPTPTTTSTPSNTTTNQMLSQVPLIQPISISNPITPQFTQQQIEMYYQQQQQQQQQHYQLQFQQLQSAQPQQQFGLQQPIQQQSQITPIQRTTVISPTTATSPNIQQPPQ